MRCVRSAPSGWGPRMPIEVWEGAEVPAHLRVNVLVVDANGRELGSGRDLPALETQLGEAAQLTFRRRRPRVRARRHQDLGLRRSCRNRW